MAKYAPLKRYLLSCSGPETTMSFSEIEAVIGAVLPPSARKHQAWWANHGIGHVNAQAWLDAGWETCRVDLASGRVVFVRRQPPRGVQEADSPPFDAESAIIISRSLLTGAAARLLDEAEGATPGERAAAVLNEAARARRRALVERFASTSPRLTGDSAAMIRDDRDAR